MRESVERLGVGFLYFLNPRQGGAPQTCYHNAERLKFKLGEADSGGEPRGGRGSSTRTGVPQRFASLSQKELAEISLDPPCNCSAGPKGDNIYEWVSTIVGPAGEEAPIAPPSQKAV